MDRKTMVSNLYPEGYNEQVKKECCSLETADQGINKAELCGLLMAGAVPIFDDSAHIRGLTVQTDVFAVAGRIYRFSRQLFGMSPTVGSVESAALRRGMIYQVSFGPEGLEKMLKDLRLLKQRDGKPVYDPQGVPPYYMDKQRLIKAFIRGVFLTAGTMTDPQKTFRLELACNAQGLLNDLEGILSQYDIHTHPGRRHKRFVLTAREGESVATFLQLIGANKALFALEDSRAIRELRNDTNRRVNCDVSNLNKVADAAGKQLGIIKVIESRRGLECLPESLLQLARLRKTYPDISIRELGEKMTPPLSKSGVYKRFEKMERIARECDRSYRE